MGISKPAYEFMAKILDQSFPDYSYIKMVEIGNQHFTTHSVINSPKLQSLVAKDFFELLGIPHTSIDITGLDRSIALDLTEPIPSELAYKFNVLTNFGTSEHIDNQYACFKNFHWLLDLGGVMIHEVPMTGHWSNHCHWYYNEDFFEAFTGDDKPYELLDKELIHYDNQGFTIAAALKRKTRQSFIDTDLFNSKITYSGDNLHILEYWTQYLTKPEKIEKN